MRKYIVHPGPVYSKNDFDRHHISAGQLMRLYGVSVSECLVCAHCQGRKMLPCVRDAGYVHLYPRSDGNYELPQVGDE